VSPRKTPIEELLVRSAFLYSIDQVTIADAEKFEAISIETLAQIRLILRGKIAFRVEANLIEHTAEIDQTANLPVGTSNRGIPSLPVSEPEDFSHRLTPAFAWQLPDYGAADG